MNNEAIKQFIAARLAGAAALLSNPALDPAQRTRADAARTALLAIDAAPDFLVDEKALATRIAAAAQRRDSQKRFSAAWLRADAEFDVLVALQHDITPIDPADFGDGSNPAPVEAAS